MSDDDLDARVIANLRELQQRNAARPDPPPLRIHHLMACAVVTAVLLSLSRMTSFRMPARLSPAGVGVFAYSQVLSAVGLTLTGFSIYWWRKGYASFSQPGQMLLLQYAGGLLLQLITIVFMLAVFGIGGGQRPSLVPILLSITWLVFSIVAPMLFFGWCAWKIADSWPWRLLFVLCALSWLLTPRLAMLVAQFTTQFSASNIQAAIAYPQIIRGMTLLPIGISAVVTDLAARRKRSWTHWAGIFLWLSGQIGSLMAGVYYLYFWNL